MPLKPHRHPSVLMRLLLSAAAVLGCFALLFYWALIAVYANTLEESVHRRLAADARTVMAAIGEDNGKLLMPTQLDDPRFNRLESDLVALIYDREGNLLWRSRSAQDVEFSYTPVFQPDQVVFTRVSQPDGDLFVHDIDLRVGSRDYSVVTGDTAAELDQSLQQYRRDMLLWLLLSTGGVLLVLDLALAWALRPLRRVRRQLSAIARGESELLEGDFPSEIDSLARSLNRLLVAEQARNARYRTTLTELAHGLKTPLAVMSEVARMLPAGEARTTLDDQLRRVNQQVSYQLQRIVPGSSGLVPQSLPLQPVLEKLCGALDKVYRDKHVSWQLAVPDVSLALSGAQAMELFGNLLENAFRLCLQEVRISAHPWQEGLRIDVDDDGPGVPLALRETILERGCRADSRHEGEGIGLAVVVDLLEQVGGHVEIGEAALGGASFRLFLPRLVLG